MKIRPVGAELFHADRQTDRRDETNYAERPKRFNNTDTHSEYVVLIAFALQNGCKNAPQYYVISILPYCLLTWGHEQVQKFSYYKCDTPLRASYRSSLHK
jgi:hypothetical protein